MSPLDAFSLDGGEVLVGVGLAVASIVLSVGLATAVVVRMPADYFEAEDAPRSIRVGSRLYLTLRRVAKNLLGVVLIAVGIVLSLPGVPGQGLLTIVVGLVLLDLRAKRRLERRLVRSERLLGALNALRARFARPPLLPPRFASADHEVPREEQGGEREQDGRGGPLPRTEQETPARERASGEGPALDGRHPPGA